MPPGVKERIYDSDGGKGIAKTSDHAVGEMWVLFPLEIGGAVC